MPQPPAVSWFAAASAFLNRPDPACEAHRVRHTGKLARSIVLDLALLSATGDSVFWERARQRARYVASQLARDPQHGAFVYLPGRFDARNCSNSVIDSGECTDALARLLLHDHAATLGPEERAAVWRGVERNAETYLRRAVVEKEITNQRLWGAMGLASAYRVEPRGAWRDAIRQSVGRSLAEQRPDGSWGYQPEAERHGAFPGAGDTTVYYLGRCLAFLLHVLDGVPDLGAPRHWWPDVDEALRRGLEFLAGVITPDGLKPLALEGKRWFWDGTYEAGSNAYDVYVLVRGAERYRRPEWRELAYRCWDQLARHQQPDGGLQACAEQRAHDFVCRDFHTADLAWPAQVMGQLPGAGGRGPGVGDQRSGVRALAFRNLALAAGGAGDEVDGPVGSAAHLTPVPAAQVPSGTRRFFRAAGVLRLESEALVALLRTSKLGRNTLFGGPVGGGSLVYLADRAGGANRLRVDRESPVVEGNFTLYPARAQRRAALIRYFGLNPPGREGRQWLFVARLLLARRRPLAAATRFWRGYLQPLARSLGDPVASHWAIASDVNLEDESVRIACRPARADGSVPRWASAVAVTRAYDLPGDRLHVSESVRCEDRSGPSPIGRVLYLLPRAARDVQFESSERVGRRGTGGRRLELRPTRGEFWLRVTYNM